MADIELIIKIPEETYRTVYNEGILPTNIIVAIKNGTLLPEGHGRLIDADAFIEFLKHKEYGIIDYSDIVIDDIKEEAPTIIESKK